MHELLVFFVSAIYLNKIEFSYSKNLYRYIEMKIFTYLSDLCGDGRRFVKVGLYRAILVGLTELCVGLTGPMRLCC